MSCHPSTVLPFDHLAQSRYCPITWNDSSHLLYLSDLHNPPFPHSRVIHSFTLPPGHIVPQVAKSPLPVTLSPFKIPLFLLESFNPTTPRAVFSVSKFTGITSHHQFVQSPAERLAARSQSMKKKPFCGMLQKSHFISRMLAL